MVRSRHCHNPNRSVARVVPLKNTRSLVLLRIFYPKSRWKTSKKNSEKKKLSSLMVDHHYPIETAMVCPLSPITPLITAPPNWVIPDLTEGCGKGAAPCLEVWSQRQLKEIWESGLKTHRKSGMKWMKTKVFSKSWHFSRKWIENTRVNNWSIRTSHKQVSCSAESPTPLIIETWMSPSQTCQVLTIANCCGCA